MSELSQKARHYEKRTREIRRRIIKLCKARDRVKDSLRHLNWQYEFGSIDYSTYSKLFDEHLNFKTVEEYDAWFDSEEIRLRQRLSHYESRLEKVRARRSSRSRTFAALSSVMLVMAIMLGAAIYTDTLPTEQLVTGMAAGVDKITGFASATSTIGANATVEVYFAVASSTNLTSGIDFGSLSHGTDDNNATANFNDSSMTGYRLDLSSDSNVNIDICVKADDDLTTSDSETLLIANMTFSNDTTNNADQPSKTVTTALSKTTWTNATQNLGTGSSAFFRFYLDVPDAQAPGTYNNTLEFNLVQNGKNCSIVEY